MGRKFLKKEASAMSCPLCKPAPAAHLWREREKVLASLRARGTAFDNPVDVNSEGTSVKGGLVPDIPVERDITDASPLGDRSEFLLGLVLSHIQGDPIPTGSRSMSQSTPLPAWQEPLPMLIILQE